MSTLPIKEGMLDMDTARFWKTFQEGLFPENLKALETSSNHHRKIILVLNMIRIEEFIPYDPVIKQGRPKRDRSLLARAFIVKEVLGLLFVKDLIIYLNADPFLKRICGWYTKKLPCEATFSNAFRDFVKINLAEKVHKILLSENLKQCENMIFCRDSTDIPAREKAVITQKKAVKKYPVGRPRKNEVREKKETVISRQMTETLEKSLSLIPKHCNYGKKKKDGKSYSWKGYKFHLDTTEKGIPIAGILSSASESDFNVAIPLHKKSQRICLASLALMDKGYDSQDLRNFHKVHGTHAITQFKKRRNQFNPELSKLESSQIGKRNAVERAFSRLKDSFHIDKIRYKGYIKVNSKIHFSLLVLTAMVFLESG